MSTRWVSLSGGVDSTAALHMSVAQVGAPSVQAVAFNYGQRHLRELDAAAAVARFYNVALRVIDARGLLSGGSLLGEGEVPRAAYDVETMADTVVQGRNLLFASTLIALARPGDAVVLGVHAGDHHLYPDCRPGFVEHVRGCAAAYGVEVMTPWLYSTKAQIVATARHAPYGLTWSCYVGGDAHCGECGTCVERAEAFALAGVPDPTRYLTIACHRGDGEALSTR